MNRGNEVKRSLCPQIIDLTFNIFLKKRVNFYLVRWNYTIGFLDLSQEVILPRKRMTIAYLGLKRVKSRRAMQELFFVK